MQEDFQKSRVTSSDVVSLLDLFSKNDEFIGTHGLPLAEPQRCSQKESRTLRFKKSKNRDSFTVIDLMKHKTFDKITCFKAFNLLQIVNET